MNKTIKFLTVALALTTATQSFSMWNRLRCAASSMRLNVAPRLNTMRASLPTWASHLNFSRSAVAIRPAFARAAALRTAAGFGAVAAYANFAKPARAESVTGETSIAHASFHPNADGTTTIKTKLQGNAQVVISHVKAEEAKQEAEVEWTPEAMQAKLNELKAQEDRYKVYVHAAFKGTVIVKSPFHKQLLKGIEENRQLFSKCLSREGTYRTQKENESAANKEEESACADLYKKLSYGNNYKNGDLGRWTANSILPIPAILATQQDDMPGSKSDVRVDINTSVPSIDGEMLADVDFEMNRSGRRGNLHMMPDAAREHVYKNLLTARLAPGEKREIIGMNFDMPINIPTKSYLLSLQVDVVRKAQLSVALENTEKVQDPNQTVRDLR